MSSNEPSSRRRNITTESESLGPPCVLVGRLSRSMRLLPCHVSGDLSKSASEAQAWIANGQVVRIVVLSKCETEESMPATW